MSGPNNAQFLGALVRGFGKNLVKSNGDLLDAATATAIDMAAGTAAAAEGENHFQPEEDPAPSAAEVLNAEGVEIP